MRLRTSFRLSMGFSIGAILALSLVLGWSLWGSQRAREAHDLASQLQDEMGVRRLVQGEYLQHVGERPRVQWEAKSASIRRLMDRLTPTVKGQDEQEALREMAKINERVTSLFDDVVRMEQKGGRAERVGAASVALRERAGDSLRLASYEANAHARRLAQGASMRFESTWRRAAILVLVMIGFALAITVGNAILTITVVQRRVVKLRDGAERIATGALEHRIGMAGNDELADLGRAFDAMTARLQETHGALEQEVAQRRHAQEELEASNRELEAFSYSVSHDLRAPLRSIAGFSQAALEDYGPQLGETGRQYLDLACQASREMGQLIDDLISLSRVTRAEMALERVDLSELSRSIAAELRRTEPDRAVEVEIVPDLVARGDPVLLRLALDNLLRNAWKFTSKHPTAHITVGRARSRDRDAFFVADDGAGLDMVYASKLFQPFQRLHGTHEFPGTGIGLATVKRIVRRHGGEVWIHGEVEKGATVYLTLSSGVTDASEGHPVRRGRPEGRAADGAGPEAEQDGERDVRRA